MPTPIKTILDETILEMLHTSLLIVDLDTSEVWYNGKKKTPTVVGKEGVNGVRYRIEIFYQRSRRTISRNKLVYMAGTRRQIPEGYEIHHIDGDRFNDAFSNLVCVSIDDHLKLHGKFNTPF